jgi:electron transport complex protein RnfA
MLAVFSGLSMNLILQFGLGLKEIALTGNTQDTHINIRVILKASGVLFVSVVILWLVFSFFRSFWFLGLFEYVLLFPVSVMFFSFLEYVTKVFIARTPKRGETIPVYEALSGGAPVAAALFVTLNVAGSLLELTVLSLGFSCGMVLAVLIASEIRRRSQMELVPRWLRGGPLVIVALGLLSLVFSSGALMLFQVLGA